MAGFYNFTIEQFSDFEKTIYWRDSQGVDISLVGVAAEMQIRNPLTDEIIKDCTANISITDKIKLSMTAIETAIFDSKIYGNNLVYDILLTKNGIVNRLLQGRISISNGVTK